MRKTILIRMPECSPGLNVVAWFMRHGLVILVLVGVMASDPTALWGQSIPPSVTIDLRSLGYLVPTAKRDLRSLIFLHDAVSFLDEQTLAVSYFVKNDHSDFTRRDGAPSGPVLFHSAFVDTRTGSVSAQRSWSNNGYWNTFLRLDNGSFLIQANNWISLYSRSFQQLARRRLIYPGDLMPRFQVSPSGRTLYGFQDWQEPGSHTWITKIAWLDSATLEVKREQITALHSLETVSDLQVVYRVSDQQMILESFAPKSELALDMPLRNSEIGKLLIDSHCTSMAFVSNSVLAIAGDCPRLILLEPGNISPGGLRADLHFGERKVGGEFQSSRDGNRLAFIISDRNPARSLEGGVEVNVYDLTERRVIFASQVSPIPQLKLAIALSPAGSQLAVMSDRTLHIWQLPHSN